MVSISYRKIRIDIIVIVVLVITIHFKQKKVKVGDTLMITDEWAYDTVYDYNEYKCNTNGEDHCGSYITGRLIKRLK